MIMEGKVALVTGAGEGIGEAVARALAAEGAKVVLTDIRAEVGEEAAHRIEKAGGTVAFIRSDGTKEAEVEALVAKTVSLYGRLDCAHNNVGSGRSGSTITSMEMEEWDWTLDISLKSTWLAMKHEVPVMLANGGGAIVNTASMAGVFYTPVASPAYSAAKAAVIHLSSYAAHAYAAQGIRVNSLSPGLVATPTVVGMLDEAQQAAVAGELQMIARAVKPEEIADGVVYLLSSRSAMVTGINLEVSGGRK
jgi:NAD(P)-dependent dehydrogenase (short-subunit alcohol dehydrogenase family)